jgi:type I restriction enzyme S subunit
MGVRAESKQTKMGMVQDDWRQCSLATVTSEIGDGIHATPNYSSTGQYYFINGNNLRNGRIVITEDTKAVDELEFRIHHKLLNNNSILMSINGTIGNLALYSGGQYILDKSAASIYGLMYLDSMSTMPFRVTTQEGNSLMVSPAVQLETWDWEPLEVQRSPSHPPK